MNSLLSVGVLQKEQVKSYPPAPLLQRLPDTAASEGVGGGGNQQIESRAKTPSGKGFGGKLCEAGREAVPQEGQLMMMSQPIMIRGRKYKYL